MLTAKGTGSYHWSALQGPLQLHEQLRHLSSGLNRHTLLTGRVLRGRCIMHKSEVARRGSACSQLSGHSRQQQHLIWHRGTRSMAPSWPQLLQVVPLHRCIKAVLITARRQSCLSIGPLWLQVRCYDQALLPLNLRSPILLTYIHMGT